MKLNIGENIRKNRTRLGWTQTQLAEQLGTSVQQVSSTGISERLRILVVSAIMLPPGNFSYSITQLCRKAKSVLANNCRL